MLNKLDELGITEQHHRHVLPPTTFGERHLAGRRREPIALPEGHQLGGRLRRGASASMRSPVRSEKPATVLDAHGLGTVDIFPRTISGPR